MLLLTVEGLPESYLQDSMTSSQPLSTLSHDSLSQHDTSSLSPAPASLQDIHGSLQDIHDSLLSPSSNSSQAFDTSDMMTSSQYGGTAVRRPQTLGLYDRSSGSERSFNLSR